MSFDLHQKKIDENKDKVKDFENYKENQIIIMKLEKEIAQPEANLKLIESRKISHFKDNLILNKLSKTCIPLKSIFCMLWVPQILN